MSARAAAFLDRDGVLNDLVRDRGSGRCESPLRSEDVRLISGATTAARRLRAAGYALVCVSNQPAAAKGTVDLERVHGVQRRVMELLARAGVELDAARICPHHPEGVVHELARTCNCRKPAPGMLLDAAREIEIDLPRSWMFGDTDADVAAGAAAGCRTALIEHPGSAHKRTADVEPTLVVGSLGEAVRLVLRADSAEVEGICSTD
jgi:D-glycero-D-manno-heptose 1,7-bisphosphate phosphatase